ncbi:hypothetical protein C2845_PM01G40710 [Panicum miliaceum]|uniref:Uncharacterized protein n=1 Tax=Panicum miliaceum TaxID=4540 RepID=A0A3L6TXE3_PANMI|nr:hypothetical protein C2845_PM01G40710 [Panicum miliaceum]
MLKGAGMILICLVLMNSLQYPISRLMKYRMDHFPQICHRMYLTELQKLFVKILGHLVQLQSKLTVSVLENKRPHTKASENFHESYLKLKREEIERFAAIEEKKLEDPFSIKKCIIVLERLSDLQTGDMLKAANIFKDSLSNRKV